TYILAWPSLVWAFKGTPVGMADFISSVASPAIGSIAALLVCLCIRPLLATGAESFQSLVLAAVFAASYMSVMAIIPEGRRTLSGVRELFPRTARGAG
ncbi:MAG TPA: hypothetical protein PKA41_11030, partial [Verrucomicrobiota bacterium]|nr:hypothetical protein [Verrucomicrobiota bacterium]